jgi:hypothetical protein
MLFSSDSEDFETESTSSDESALKDDVSYYNIKSLLSDLNGNGALLTSSEKLLIGLLQWKEKFSIANNSFSALLKLLELSRFDCCPKGHMCFTGEYADLDACPFCGEKRYMETQRAQMKFHYCSPLQQIRLEMLSQTRRELFLYPQLLKKKINNSSVSDFFDGRHYQKLCRLFEMENKYDFCFSISTDGFQAFKKYVSFSFQIY